MNRRARRLLRAAICVVTVAVTCVSIAEPIAFAVPARVHKSWSPFPLPKTASVPVREVVGSATTARRMPPAAPRHANWPAAGRARVDAAAAPSVQRRASGLPISVRTRDGSASTVRLRLYSRAAANRLGVHGLLFALDPATRATKSFGVRVDYSSFADAYGGSYGSRLRLVQLPACALTTPTRPACQTVTALPSSRNDVRSHRLSGSVSLSGQQTVMAASSAPSGGDGTYTATSLAPSGTWSVGNTGAFTYDYPIAVPPSVGGAAPSVGLSYNSASVDGRNSATNSQASWIGDGWDYTPGFVERNYKACADDGQADTVGDECWAGDNATLSFGAHSGQLVPTGSNNQWRLQDDDGSIVDEVSVASTSAYFNGMNAGTYWRLTTNDGTQFFFGADHLPASAGGDGTDASTQAAWGAPVYGNGAGEPCHGASWGADRCTQGWRWNLDFVVDPDQNITVYKYATETNYYMASSAADGSTHTRVSYTRGGYLTSISYGQRVPRYVSKSTAGDQVLFGVVERCDGSGGFNCTSTLTSSNASHWPDVPFDQICASTGTCTNYAPTFFTRKALSTITTKVWDLSLATAAWSTVDTYTLAAPSFPDPGDAGQTGGKAQPALWLSSIGHVGSDTRGGGSATAALTTSFLGVALPNRVSGLALPNVPPINRFRMSSITTETGAQFVVGYDTSTPCTRANPPTEDNDTSRCFPVRWTPFGYTDPVLDWFTIYPVVQVEARDNTSVWGADAAPTQVTNYSYAGPAWHRDDSKFTPDKARTWGQFRGFATVTTTTGVAPDPVTKTVAKYLQGMFDDVRKDGTQRSHADTDKTTDTGLVLTDAKYWSGFGYQTTAFSGAGGTAAVQTISTPWASAPNATQTIAGLPDLVARFTGTQQVDKRELLANGTWRTSRVVSSFYPDTGLLQDIDDLGEIDGSGNPVGGTTPERCTHTAYAADAARNMRAYPSLVITNSGACTTSAGSTTLSASRTYYDNSATLGQLTGTGNPTSIQALKQAPGTWAAASTSTFDSYGRVTQVTDPMGRVTDTSYGVTSTARTYLPTRIDTTVHPTSTTTWTSTVTLDPCRQLAITNTDVNGNVVSETYDGLGRLTQVWRPNHPKSANASTPSVKFAYAVSRTGFVSVTTSSLREDLAYNVSIQIDDALVRARQTQTTPANGARGARLISDTGYDSHGWVAYSDQAYYNADAAPATTPVSPIVGSLPARTSTTYDGRGRPLRTALYSNGAFEWASDAAYPGADRVDSDPASGGTPTSAVVDARGQQTQLRQYHGPSPAGAYDVTDYYYDAAGRQTKVVGPLASAADPATSSLAWTTTYDALGDVISRTDPDTGTTRSSYNDAGQLTSTTDANQVTVGYHYDALGRKNFTYNGSNQNSKIATWTYDPSGGNGLLQSTSRYAADGTTVTYTDTFTGYTKTGKATGETITIPANVFGNSAAITYTTTNTYTPVLDEPYTQVVKDSAASTLLGAQESESISYNVTGLPVASGGTDSYETNTFYDPHGRVTRAVSGLMPKQVVMTYQWDEPTGRLVNFTTNKEDGLAAVDNVTYSYDQAGNITSATNREDGGATPALVDRQCYSYDYVGRLTDAWTSASGTTPADPASNDVGAVGSCTVANPGADTFTGPAPYWQTYGYAGDLTGNRTTKTERTIGGDGTVAATVTTSLSYANAAGGGPHALSTATTGSTVTTYSYDGDGNTIGSTAAVNGTADSSKARTLAWTATGQVARLTTGPAASPTHTSTYGYDSDGAQIARTTDGTTTLHLGSDTLTLNSAGTVLTAVRSYAFPGGPTAVRQASASGAQLHWQCADPQGTGLIDVTADTLLVTRRSFAPFGESRAATNGPGWAGDRGFVGGVVDPTDNLTNLGAREYDASLGRFLSVDPILDASDPQSMTGYAYADGDPVNGSDPTGLCVGYPDGACPQPGGGFGGGDMCRIGGEECGSSNQNVCGCTADVTTPPTDGGGGVAAPAPAPSPAPTPAFSPTPGVGPPPAPRPSVTPTAAIPEAMPGPGWYPVGSACDLLTMVFCAIGDLIHDFKGCADHPSFGNCWGAVVDTATVVCSAFSDGICGATRLLRTGATEEKVAQILVNKAIGDAARDAAASRFLPNAVPEHYFGTPMGARYIDAFDHETRAALESKVGRTSFSKSIRAQVAKDKWLLDNGYVSSVQWVFQGSPITSKIGPTARLAAALDEAGISYMELPYYTHG